MTQAATLKTSEMTTYGDSVRGPALKLNFYKATHLASSNAASAWPEHSNAIQSFLRYPEALQNAALEQVGDQWLLSWDRNNSDMERLEISLSHADGFDEEIHHINATEFISSPRFLSDGTLLFDSPVKLPLDVNSPLSINNLLADWKITIDESANPLAGSFIQSIELDEAENFYLQLSGFKTDGPLGLGSKAFISHGGTTVQTIAMTNPERQAVLLEPLASTTDLLKGKLSVELRPGIEHNNIWLQGMKVEVEFDAC